MWGTQNLQSITEIHQFYNNLPGEQENNLNLSVSYLL